MGTPPPLCLCAVRVALAARVGRVPEEGGESGHGGALAVSDSVRDVVFGNLLRWLELYPFD